jgi:hypothetical protein
MTSKPVQALAGRLRFCKVNLQVTELYEQNPSSMIRWVNGKGREFGHGAEL